MDFTADALTTLLNFLHSRPNDEPASLSSLTNVHTETSSLECLQCVADIMIYKEEVKKKKKKEEAPVPDVLGDKIRSLSLQSMHAFAKALTEMDSDATIVFAFGNIPNIVPHLTQVIMNLEPTRNEGSSAVHDISLALDILLLIISHDAAKIDVMLTIESFLATIHRLLDEKQVQLKCLRMYHILTLHASGLPLIATSDVLSRIVEKLKESCQKCVSDAPPTGGKAKGKGLEIPADRISTLRSELSIVYAAIDTFLVVTRQAVEAVEADLAQHIVECLSPVLLSAEVRNVTSEVQHGYIEQPLTYFFRDAAILFGQLGVISEEIRVSTCNAGAVTTLLKCLRDTRQIMGQEVSEEVIKSGRAASAAAEDIKAAMPLGHDFDVLRHVIEKAVLHLVTYDFDPNEFSTRWKSCQHFVSYKSPLSEITEANSQSALAFIIDMLAANDKDLVDRCVRLLAAILQSTAEPLELLKSNKVDSAVTPKLCAVISSRAVEVAQQMEAKKESATTMENNADAPLEQRDKPVITPAPTPTSTLCLALTCLEYVLVEQDALAVFCTAERMAQLASVLYTCGPIATPTQSRAMEVHEPIRDPRRFSWEYTMLETHLDDAIYLREVLFDILSIVSVAESKYRNFEGPLPQEAGAPFPESSNPVASHVAHCFQHCANPCVVTLLHCSEYALCRDHVGVVPKDNALVIPVLNAALRYLTSVASAGMPGLSVIYTSISNLAFGGATPSTPSAVTSLKHFLSQVILPAISTDEGDMLREQLERQVTETKVPIHFSLPNNEKVFTHVDEASKDASTWVCIALMSSVTGILANPKHSVVTLRFGLDALIALCHNRNVKDEIQPALVDMFAATFLALGGCVTLSGCLGHFGVLRDNDEGISFLKYLINRGNCRERFWNDWATKQAENADTNKKKDAKKPADKKKGEADALRLPFEPDDTHVDPNHGPDGAFWRAVINISCDDMHARCRVSRPLIASVQGRLDHITSALISAGAVVNDTGEFGCTALMYALILGNEVATKELLAAGADIDMLDSQRNPTLKYAFFVPYHERLEEIFDNVSAGQFGDTCNIIGVPKLLKILLGAGVDLGVCDADGNYPLHWALGNGNLLVHIDGVAFTVSSDACAAGNSPQETLHDLITYKAVVNISNRDRITPLHIAVARGDVACTSLLLRHGAHANALDALGYLPMHYLAAVCPENNLEILMMLIEKGVRRPLYHLEFLDERTGKSNEEKYRIDAERIMENALSTALIPAIAKQTRMSVSDILLSQTLTGISVLQLALVGSWLRDEPFEPYLSPSTSVESRLNLAMSLMKQAVGKVAKDMLRSVDSMNFTCLHALTLLCEDVAANNEFIQLFSLMTDDDANRESYVTTRRVKKDVPAAWTPLHGALVTRAPASIVSILLRILPLSDDNYGHFLAGLPGVSTDVLTTIISAAIDAQYHAELLNSAVDGLRPLHVAVECKNVAFIECMAATPQADFNAVDEVTGRSPFHNACINGDDDVISAFDCAIDRIDLLLEDTEGVCAVDTVVRALDVKRISHLLQRRRNDVMERVLLVKEDRMALLQELEFENIELADKLVSLNAENENENTGSPEMALISERLQLNEEVLELILETLGDLGDVVTPDFHHNDCFAEGVIYSRRPVASVASEIVVEAEQSINDIQAEQEKVQVEEKSRE